VDSHETQAPPDSAAETAVRAGEPPAKMWQTAIRAGAPALGHPPAIWFFFWGEFAERASYYGMRGILPRYISEELGFGDVDGGSIYSVFKMACYFLPLLGGFLADRFFGKYWTIVGFSVPYVLGHFILGYPTPVFMFFALALLAGGSGVIKPNISALLGQTYDQKRPGLEILRSSAFLWFYLAVNVGAFLSTLFMPSIRNEWGYAIAFQFPAWLMVGALVVFAAGKPFYAVETPEPAHAKTPEERRLQWDTLARLFGVFGLIIFFWVAYELNDNIWVFFARDYVNCSVPAMTSIRETLIGWGVPQSFASSALAFLNDPVPPDQIQTLNPLFVIILVPVFASLFKRLDPKARIFTPTRKILAGFLLTGAATAIMALAGYLAIGSGTQVSIGWVAVAYIVLTAGEVLLYATALELSYALAPKNMKSFITACFLVTNTLGNFINSGLVRLYGGSLRDPVENRGPLSPGTFFTVAALIPLIAAIAFYFVGKQFDRQMRSTGTAAA
jgi:POT family proton-dependent oligopeptide transporter